ncbi:Gx transporter family protein [Treponema ruminis]|uniref:Heptaprenyl diphosphate synthase n=1 Tax=Treponema ruminis TaxID=744515 RepID=A0A7W8LM89_9SPIR|nr:Gx transporter family protein [Treponema ruminis]MBB5226143.1 heptaprenyl diphosphate synthase [Treponema ruminis]
MPSQNKKTVAYFAALTLLFSYIEMILPRTVPFFRLGLGNIAVLMALKIPFAPFALLCLIKAIAASLMSGTLFSPFFIISLAQSISSGIFMYLLSGLNRKSGEKLLSVYGISVFGAGISALVQILCCALYLGSGTFALFGPILIFNTASGILTAFFSLKFQDSEKTSFAKIDIEQAVESQNQKSAFLQILLALAILFAAASIFFIKNIAILATALVLSLAAQKFCKRKILLLPHISLWIFILISTILVPEGKVLFKIWNVSVTEGAFVSALQKSLRLSAVSALSQCAVSLRPPKDSILALTLLYYKGMSDKFIKAKGNIFQRAKESLN